MPNKRYKEIVYKNVNQYPCKNRLHQVAPIVEPTVALRLQLSVTSAMRMKATEKEDKYLHSN